MFSARFVARRDLAAASSRPISTTDCSRFAAGSNLGTPQPNATAYAERWVGSVRRECLDRILILGRRQVEQVLRVYVRHNQHRPDRALELRPPDADIGTDPPPAATARALRVRRRDLLGGLLHEYEAAA
jgi:putative transposase